MKPDTSAPITIGYWRIRALGAPVIYVCEYLDVPYTVLYYEQGGPPDFSMADFRDVKDSLGMPFPNLPSVL